MKWAAQTKRWTNTAIRPDMYPAPVQRAASAEAVGKDLPSDGSGEIMPRDVQAKMEGAFGTDFSAVRIHQGPRSEALGALAYTQGTDIHFASGQYQPNSQSGQSLLGHELAHVVQQSQGRVQATTQMKGVGVNTDSGLEQEADEMGAKAGRGGRVIGDAAVASTGGNPAALQMRSGARPVQMQRIAVAGGTFNDGGSEMYKPYTEAGEFPSYGAQMSKLTFTPKNAVKNSSGTKAKEISLVQTTNSTIEERDTGNSVVDAVDQPESMLDERRTESGTAIDQQILLVGKGKPGKWQAEDLVALLDPVKAKGTKKVKYKGTPDTPVNDVLADFVDNFKDGGAWDKTKKASTPKINGLKSNLKNILDAEGGDCDGGLKSAIEGVKALLDKMTTLVNLDPRYAEERHKETAKMKPGKPRNSEAKMTTGWNAHRGDITKPWEGNAVLRDRPAHTIAAGNTLEGTEKFEVAAMADGDKFVGSIEWGWMIDGTEPELINSGKITKVADGASDEFYEAVEKWNEMEVPDPLDSDVTHETMQLPTKPE